jgi:hypothetical protein
MSRIQKLINKKTSKLAKPVCVPCDRNLTRDKMIGIITPSGLFDFNNDFNNDFLAR